MAFNQGINRVTLAHFPSLPSYLGGTMAHQWLATWGIAEQMGAALAALVMTLKKAPADARAARLEWPEAHWKTWMNVQQIILGGGVLDGELGRQVFASATHWIEKLGIEKLGSGVKLILPARPRNVMLEGLGREFADGTVVVLDAGHTAMKRGLVTMQSGNIKQVQLKEPVPIPYHLLKLKHLSKTERPEDFNWQRRENAEVLLIALLDVLFEMAKLEDQPTQFGISLSVPLNAAGNVESEVETMSVYKQLVGIQLKQLLKNRLEERLGYPVHLIIQHEAQAAANAVPNVDASILLGTSVGGGLKAD